MNVIIGMEKLMIILELVIIKVISKDDKHKMETIFCWFI